MQNRISEIEYEKFVLEHLAPMPIESTKKHVEWSLQEELLEVQIVEANINALQHELKIWAEVKPKVKFIRQFKKEPTFEELRGYKTNTLVKRTLHDGTKIEKTFDQHILDIDSESWRVLTKVLTDELGDVLFFVVAAESEKVNHPTPLAFQEAKKVLDYYVNNLKITTYEALRVQNFQKLAGGENARYKNGYSVKEDLKRK